MRVRSMLVVLCLVGLSVGLNSPNAGAAFHVMKVREVYAGSSTQTNADFVELQMYHPTAPQNQVGGHKLRLYNAAGAMRECTIPQHVANGANQETILFATTEAQSAFGVADFTIPAFLSGSAGAVCFEGIDCVSWGSFPGGASDTDGGPGTPFPGGIPVGQSIDRKVGTNNTLEAADDTNNSANDFEAEAPTPNPNGATNLGTTTCTEPTGGAGDTDEPKTKITAPKHRSAITVKQARNFQGTAKDQSGTVTKVEIALRQKLKGSCKWWHGSSFVAGSCSTRSFVMATGDKNWSYTLSRKLKPSNGRIRNYTLFSRATDATGNVESEFVPKANLVRFEVFKPPITCMPGC